MTKKRTPDLPGSASVVDLGGSPMFTSAVFLEELAANPTNPRHDWKPDQVEPFRASLRRFGDLGGIVRNLTSGQLVGGHKRVEVFRLSHDVRIVKTDQPEDEQGTVAHGYVVVDGNRFAYREVRWSPEVEAAANLAANRWAADWNWERVSETLQAISTDELRSITGFPAHELDNLLAAEWNPEPRGDLSDGDTGGSMHLLRVTDLQFDALQRAKRFTSDREHRPFSDGEVIKMLCDEYLGRDRG